jgi:hypothetical protein
MSPFVGFAASPKPDPDRKLRERDIEVELAAGLKSLLGPLSTGEAFARLLDELVKFDFRPGGRVSFKREEEVYRGAFSQINIPKSIFLSTERHGELNFHFNETGDRAVVRVTVRRALLESEVSEWMSDCDRIETELRSGYGN